MVVFDTSRLVYAHIEGTLTSALDLLARVDEVYRLGGPKTRRLANPRRALGHAHRRGLPCPHDP
jgi:hypothetical protein